MLAPGGFAVEFQASALTREEVRAREDDWSAQGGMAWVFKADQAHIGVTEQYLPQWLHLLKPENQMTVRVTWPRAPERVRAAHAPSFLDVGDDELLFIGGWRLDSSPLSGWGWKVATNWVVENLLYADQIPGPLAAILRTCSAGSTYGSGNSEKGSGQATSDDRSGQPGWLPRTDRGKSGGASGGVRVTSCYGQWKTC